MDYQAFASAFVGTATEFFETVVISYALFRAGYRREVAISVIVGHLAVFALAFVFYRFFEQLPLFWLRLGAALMLLCMGAYWTAKSAKRLKQHKRPRWVEDPLGKAKLEPRVAAVSFSALALLAAMKTSVVEAAEIVVVVLPIAVTSSAIVTVILAVCAGITAVLVMAAVMHRRLRAVPEVWIKLLAGIILTALGGWWIFEAFTEHEA